MGSGRGGCLALMALLTGLVAGCLSPFDALGNETVVTENEHLEKDAGLSDDRIEDKHPVFDASRTVTEVFEGCEVVLNKSAAVAKLDIAPFGEGEAGLEGRLFPDRASAIAAALASGRAELTPSMEVVNGSMKPFNDGLYAAVELEVDGAKRALLAGLLAKLVEALPSASATQRPHLKTAAVFLGTALELRGQVPELPEDLLDQARAQAAAFRTDTLFARPIGFYTWNATLEGVFTSDRFLQSGDDVFALPFGAAVAIAVVLEADAGLTDGYQRVLALNSHLTNPPASYPLTRLFPYIEGLSSLESLPSLEARVRSENPPLAWCGGPYVTVFPASRSKDSDFYAQRWCDSSPPAGSSFIDLLIEGIRSGAVDLTPTADSGWYDYQLQALETLLLPERGPESEHLLLTAAYKKKLLETFKSLITQARETHVKQLAVPGFTASVPLLEIDLYPQRPVEPFPTFYLRSARGYRFLSTFLTAFFDDGLLVGGHRLNEDGTSSAAGLGEELRAMTERLYGLHRLAAESVGVDPDAALLPEELVEFPRDAARTRAREWLAGWTTDVDVRRDPRVMVPVARTAEGQTLAWATIGVKVYKSSAAFVAGHEPKVVSSGYCVVKGFVGRDAYLLVEEMVEVRLRPGAAPPTREELRRLCDEKVTREGIVSALEAL